MKKDRQSFPTEVVESTPELREPASMGTPAFSNLESRLEARRCGLADTLGAESSRFFQGQHVTHITRGDGVVEHVDLKAAKRYTVRFRSGEKHAYSEHSATKLQPKDIGKVVQCHGLKHLWTIFQAHDPRESEGATRFSEWKRPSISLAL